VTFFRPYQSLTVCVFFHFLHRRSSPTVFFFPMFLCQYPRLGFRWFVDSSRHTDIRGDLPLLSIVRPLMLRPWLSASLNLVLFLLIGRRSLLTIPSDGYFWWERFPAFSFPPLSGLPSALILILVNDLFFLYFAVSFKTGFILSPSG